MSPTFDDLRFTGGTPARSSGRFTFSLNRKGNSDECLTSHHWVGGQILLASGLMGCVLVSKMQSNGYPEIWDTSLWGFEWGVSTTESTVSTEESQSGR